MAALAAYVTSFQLVPVYKASTMLLVEHSGPCGSPITGRIAHTYAQLLTKRPVLDAAIKELALDDTWEELEKRVTAEVVPGTQLIRLSVEDTDPVRAALTADTIASQFIVQMQVSYQERYADSLDFLQQQIDELSSRLEETQAAIEALDTPETAEKKDELARLEAKLDGYHSTLAVLVMQVEEMHLTAARWADHLYIYEKAKVPDVPVRPRMALNTALGGVAGMVLAIGFVGLFTVITIIKSSRNHHKLT